jgi:hypothetical protein
MSDTPESQPLREPPKIKLNLDAAADKPAPAKPAAPPASPPPIRLGAKPAAAAPKPVPTPPPAPPSVTPPAPPAAMPPKAARLEPKPVSEPKPEPKQPEAVKPQPEATPTPAKQPAIPTLSQVLKSKTIQLDEIAGESLDDLYKAALNATQKVILDDQGTDAAAAEKAKSSTAQLDVQQMLEETDEAELLKQQTMAIDMQGQVVPPRRDTARVINPEDIKPPSATMAIPMPDELEDDRGKTARIELPPEAGAPAPGQRKAIRIKRPGEASSAGKPLSVTRRASAPGKQTTKATTTVTEPDAGLHPIFAVAAVLAVISTLAVIYLLTAIIMPGVPFPGRLV